MNMIEHYKLSLQSLVAQGPGLYEGGLLTSGRLYPEYPPPCSLSGVSLSRSFSLKTADKSKIGLYIAAILSIHTLTHSHTHTCTEQEDIMCSMYRSEIKAKVKSRGNFPMIPVLECQIQYSRVRVYFYLNPSSLSFFR